LVTTFAALLFVVAGNILVITITIVIEHHASRFRYHRFHYGPSRLVARLALVISYFAAADRLVIVTIATATLLSPLQYVTVIGWLVVIITTSLAGYCRFTLRIFILSVTPGDTPRFVVIINGWLAIAGIGWLSHWLAYWLPSLSLLWLRLVDYRCSLVCHWLHIGCHCDVILPFLRWPSLVAGCLRHIADGLRHCYQLAAAGHIIVTITFMPYCRHHCLITPLSPLWLVTIILVTLRYRLRYTLILLSLVYHTLLSITLAVIALLLPLIIARHFDYWLLPPNTAIVISYRRLSLVGHWILVWSLFTLNINIGLVTN